MMPLSIDQKVPMNRVLRPKSLAARITSVMGAKT